MIVLCEVVQLTALLLLPLCTPHLLFSTPIPSLRQYTQLYASKTQNNPLDDALAAELMDAVLQVPGALLTEEREKVRAEVLAIFEQ